MVESRRTLAKTFELYYAAAKQGHYQAQERVGYLYRDGKGVASSVVEAVQWYRQSARQGYLGGAEALSKVQF